MSTKTLNINHTTAPADNQVCIVFDTTRGLMGSQASISTTAAGLVPGAYRNRFAHAVVKVIAECATNNITVLDQILTGDGSAAADWETQAAAGSHTIVAGADPANWEFKPVGADWRIRISGGATAATAVKLRVAIVLPSTDFGN